MRRLLEVVGSGGVNAKDNIGYTPIMNAVRCGNLRSVRIMTADQRVQLEGGRWRRVEEIAR